MTRPDWRRASLCSLGAVAAAVLALACGGGKSGSRSTAECDAGTTACSGTCVDTQTNTANCGVCGHACAQGQVCAAGACRDCAAGGSCVPTEPCRTGAYSCGTGVPVCEANGTAPDGTSCGGSNVCAGGECIAGTAPSGGARALSSAAGRMSGGAITLDAQLGMVPSATKVTGGTITLQGAVLTR